LSFPSILENGIGKLFGVKSKMGPLLQQFGSLLGSGFNEEQLMGKIEQTKSVIDEVNKQFKNPVKFFFFF
jgi:arsenite/tail-anchored protein-transporting ATPase